jgi:hypothetical protein
MVRPHVVGVWEAEEFIEAVVNREKRRVMTEVPFAENGGGVTFLLHQFGERHFVFVKTHFSIWAEGTLNADAIGIATSEEGGAGSGADRLSDVKAGKTAAFAGEAIEVRGFDVFGAKGGDVGIAKVISEDQDDVWRAIGGGDGMNEERENSEGDFRKKFFINVQSRANT